MSGLYGIPARYLWVPVASLEEAEAAFRWLQERLSRETPVFFPWEWDEV